VGDGRLLDHQEDAMADPREAKTQDASAWSERDAAEAARAEVEQLVANDDRHDFDFAQRGFIATRTDPIIARDGGGVARDLSDYDFLADPAAPTVNPSLWRHAQILTKHGLFQVADGIYQVRGFDLSTISFIDAGSGWIVVDPLTTVECARAALALLCEQVATKPVLAVVYSHSHVDHYGGVLGVTSEQDVAAGRVRVIAPAGFLEHAISENIIAGPASRRRARFQFGGALTRGPEGDVTSGLGPGGGGGTTSLVAPTDTVSATGQEIIIGDVTLLFQMTPETEAPSEMNFYLPASRALFMAENANLTMHNLLPARGALVRNAKAWADYLTEAIRLFGPRSDVMFAAHGIPRFGTDDIVAFLKNHRDAYKFLHDQTVRLMNNGLTPTEIAEAIRLPDVLATQWYNRGYYGTMSHNSKAVYQRYLGWYDANPANLWPLPPEAAAVRYVEAMGGADAVLMRAKAASDQGEYRWAATLLNHAVFADGANMAAREALAEIYTQLGYQAEAGSWRNIYLTGALELRTDRPRGTVGFRPEAMLRAATTAMVLDVAAVSVHPDRAAGVSFALNIEITDRDERCLVSVGNGVLIHEEGVTDPEADATVRLRRPVLLMTLFGAESATERIASGDIQVKGQAGLYEALVAIIQNPDPNFNIVVP
jgi:alkyl sulfatase BDS1-like metallo-beta-lactamase superfamily hydrolase